MKINSVGPVVSGKGVKRMDVDLEEAMDLAGVGKYQVFHCTLMLLTLNAAILEMIGYAFILPAAACDLDIPDQWRGAITSIPNIGIILTAALWGRAADNFGRKPILLLSSSACGIISLLAAFMPNLWSFALCKFLGALFISCPSSLSFAYAGEMTPRRRRDLAVVVCNGFITLLSTFSPLFAWAILPMSWQFYIGSLSMRPWRLLAIVYALPFVLISIWMTQAKESPKFLMAKGRREEALEVLRHIFAVNSGFPRDDYEVLSLKYSTGDLVEETDSNTTSTVSEITVREKQESVFALLKPPYLKWFALISFLMFGLFTSLNGLWLFATDTINRVPGDTSAQSGTLCTIMNLPDNKTSTNTTSCTDSISQETFVIMATTTAIYGVIVLGFSLLPLGKKALLVGMFVVTTAACLLAGLLTNMVIAGIAFSSLQMTSLGIGPLTAYAVMLFPTSLRGTAVGAVMMWGRVGSVVGANLAGFLLAVACTAAFYTFGGLLMICAILSFLLPKEHRIPRRQAATEAENDNR